MPVSLYFLILFIHLPSYFHLTDFSSPLFTFDLLPTSLFPHVFIYYLNSRSFHTKYFPSSSFLFPLVFFIFLLLFFITLFSFSSIFYAFFFYFLRKSFDLRSAVECWLFFPPCRPPYWRRLKLTGGKKLKANHILKNDECKNRYFVLQNKPLVTGFDEATSNKKPAAKKTITSLVT